jgi:hypothetical protein
LPAPYALCLVVSLPAPAALRPRQDPPAPPAPPQPPRYGPGPGPDFLRGEGATSTLEFVDVIWRAPVCVPSQPAGTAPAAAPNAGGGAAAAAPRRNNTLGGSSSFAAAAEAGSDGGGGHEGGGGGGAAVHTARVCIPAALGYDSAHGDSVEAVPPGPEVAATGAAGQECYPKALRVPRAAVPVQPRSQDLGVAAIGDAGVSYT